MSAEVSPPDDFRSGLVPDAGRTLKAIDELLAARLAGLRGVLADAGYWAAYESRLHVDLIAELERRLGDHGKRLRPRLAHQGWVLAGGRPDTWETLVQVAAAMELLHLFGLVHDDVMDRSDTRHGRVTLHVAAARRHQEAAGMGDPILFGDSVAVLLGDLALSEAGSLVGGCPAPVQDAWRAMLVELVQGQLLDVTHAADPRRDATTSRLIARLKSGRYTATRPLQLGALVAGAASEWLDQLVHWGDLLGDAFALRDDVLGVWGDPTVTGKPADDDLLDGKPTVLLVWADELLDESCRPLLAACVEGSLDPAQVQALRAAMDRAGVRRRAESEIGSLAAQAEELIAQLTADATVADGLRDLVRAVAWRTA